MTFNHRYDITLTEMAQWVDKNMLLSSYNEDEMVEYMYHLTFTCIQQKGLVKDFETCDDFALYCVSKLISRINNKELEPLKSIVNYIKTVICPWHSEYIKLFCSGSPDIELADFNLDDFGDYLIDAASAYDNVAYSYYCFKLSDVVEQHLRKIPRKKHDCEWSNICTSCLLTLKDRIVSASELLKKSLAKDDVLLINRIVRSLKTKPPILFHIDISMSSYISVLVNELVHAIASELSYSSPLKVQPSACLKNLVMAASNEEE